MGSSSISNESVTDSPSGVIVRSNRIVHDRFSDPLSEVSTNYLYNFTEEACHKCHGS